MPSSSHRFETLILPCTLGVRTYEPDKTLLEIKVDSDSLSANDLCPEWIVGGDRR